MEWNEEKFEANRLTDIAELEKLKGKLYAGYILALDGDGYIRVEVYKRGSNFICFLHHAVASKGNARWFRSGRCHIAQLAVIDALRHAGYGFDGTCWEGWEMLRRIGLDHGGRFELYSFGWF